MFKAFINSINNSINLFINHAVTDNTLDSIKRAEEIIENFISICEIEKKKLMTDHKLSIPEKFDFKYVKFTKKELDQFDKYLLKTRKTNKKEFIEKMKQEQQKENITTDAEINELVSLFDNLSKRVCIDEYQLPTKKEIDILSIRNEVENASFKARFYYNKEVVETYIKINDTCEPFKCYENSEKTVTLLDYNELSRFIPSSLLKDITEQLMQCEGAIIVNLKGNEERKAVTGKIVNIMLYTIITYDDESLPKDDINIIKQMLLLSHKLTYSIKKV
jgi:hypothetical protein